MNDKSPSFDSPFGGDITPWLFHLEHPETALAGIPKFAVVVIVEHFDDGQSFESLPLVEEAVDFLKKNGLPAISCSEQSEERKPVLKVHVDNYELDEDQLVLMVSASMFQCARLEDDIKREVVASFYNISQFCEYTLREDALATCKSLMEDILEEFSREWNRAQKDAVPFNILPSLN